MGTICLLGLGSNLGDRKATLDAALAEIAARPQVELLQASTFHRTAPIGGPTKQAEFFNAAAVIETELPPRSLLAELSRIEHRFGRKRRKRWAARTLDLDLLLYGDAVLDAEDLVVPHPRMSFRPFVLKPSAEIAGGMVHPTIGWSIRQLWERLKAPTDRLVIVSPSSAWRRKLVETLILRCHARMDAPPASPEASLLWPPPLATWLRVGRGRELQPFPRLTVVLAPHHTDSAKATGRQPVKLHRPGRGPTLWLTAADPAETETEAVTAVQAAWPDLSP